MKKKLSSALALGMALALTFSMTAFAAPSPTTDAEKALQKQADETTIGEIKSGDKSYDGKDVALSEDKAQEAAAEAAKANFTKDGKTYEVKAGGFTLNLDVQDAAGSKIEGNAIVPIKNANIKKGVAYLVLHEYAAGQWENQIVVADVDGQLTVTLKGVSPVAIFELAEKAGSTSSNASSNNNTAATTTTSPATAPKTGETLPVAGIVAVIALAGIAVSAKKVRVNN